MFRVAEEMDPAAEPVAIIAAAARGDLRAFEHLYRQFAPRVYGLCLRLTGQREATEDCTQESFVAAWRALSRFEQRSRFSTWLHRIAANGIPLRTIGSAPLSAAGRQYMPTSPGGWCRWHARAWPRDGFPRCIRTSFAC